MKYLDENGLSYLWSKIKLIFATKTELDAKPTARIYYGTCSTAANTYIKSATVEAFPLDTNNKPLVGTVVGIKYALTNTYKTAGHTYNLNVNNTGDYPMYYNNAELATSTSANTLVAGYKDRYSFYMFNGTQWIWLASGYDTNSTYSAMTLTEINNGTGTTGRTMTPKILRENFYTETEVDTLLSSKANSATTLAGYGITDANISSGVITLGNNSITPLTSHQDISGKANKSEMSISTSGDETTITLKTGTSATVINAHQDISGKADKSTTLSGYGITDAKINNGTITLGSNTITPITSHLDISGKANISDLADVATSGSYNDLIDTPTIPAAQIQSDWNQSDNTKKDFIKNKPNIPSLSGYATETWVGQQGYLTSYTETDPTVPSWAKLSSKPTYTAQEVGALPSSTTIPSALSDLSDDSTHRVVTDTEKSTWNGKSDFSGSYNDLSDKPTIPTVPTNVSAFTNDAGYLTEHQDISGKVDTTDLATVATTGSYDDLSDKPTIPTIPTNVSAFINDAGYLTQHLSLNGYATETWVGLQGYLTSFTETDPTVPAWAKAASKPNYTASEVGALPDSTTIPSALSDLSDDSTHRIVTDTEKSTWSGKQDALVSGTNIKTINNESLLGTGNISISEGDSNVIEAITFNGSSVPVSSKTAAITVTIPDAQIQSDWNATTGMGVILNKPTIPTVPTNVSDFTNDAGYLTSHQDISGKADVATTLAGYGITDAKIDGGVITLGNNTITPITSHQDISGKADKSEMSVSTNGDSTTITLKSGTLATVINAHLSLSGKQDIIDSSHKLSADLISDGTTNKAYTATELTKLSGIAAGAEVNQNTFSNVKIGSSTIAADGKTDTIEFVAGSNNLISLTADTTNDKVTIEIDKDLSKYNNSTSGFITSASIPGATNTSPKMDGTAAVGSEATWAKGDHVHPHDSTKANVSDLAAVATSGSYFDLIDSTQYIVCSLSEYTSIESYDNNTCYIIESSDETKSILKIMKGNIEVWPLHYITNGLVYHFDGINKGEDDTKWTDLISGAYFTLNSHSSVGDNYIAMDGSGYLTGSISMAKGYSLGTIEICVERTSGSGSAIIFFSGGTSGLSAIISGAGMCFGAGSNCQYALANVNKFTWSANNSMCLYNGTKYTTISSNTWNNTSSVATLGARNNGTAYYFTGKIYSIRIYDRKLTESEMLMNLKLDNSRFNLGLNI